MLRMVSGLGEPSGFPPPPATGMRVVGAARRGSTPVESPTGALVDESLTVDSMENPNVGRGAAVGVGVGGAGCTRCVEATQRERARDSGLGRFESAPRSTGVAANAGGGCAGAGGADRNSTSTTGGG